MNARIRGLARLALLAAAVALPACKDGTGPKAGPAARLDIVAGNTQSAPVGTELPQAVVVKVTDAKGRPVKGQVVNFVVTAGGGHVFAGTALTNDDGVAQERWTLGTVAGAPQTLEARAVDTNTGQALVFATFTATATPGAPATLVALNGDTTVVGVSGAAVDDSFAVLVRDAHGNPVPGVQVAWAVVSGGGTIVSPSTTDAQGIARTQWVLGPGGGGAQQATATLGAQSVRFTAAMATALSKSSGDGQRTAGGTTIAVTVTATGPTGPVAGLPVRWQVGTGGGSVAPAASVTDAAGKATAQWTLGASGSQTLTATSGTLSATFTATAVSPGGRTLLAQVPGIVLDATAGRVAWLKPTTREIFVRTISTGADALVKVDTVKNGDVAVWSVSAQLFTGGVLVRNYFDENFAWRAGTLEYLGQVQSFAAKDDWAAGYVQGTGLVRWNLPAGTSSVVPGGTSLFDVARDGSVAWRSGTSILLYRNGSTSTLSSTLPSDIFGAVFTDGVNVAYRLDPVTTFNTRAYLAFPTGDELLGGASLRHSGRLDLLLEGGWTAWGMVGEICCDFQLWRRSPAGARVQLNAGANTVPAALEALGPNGSVVYAAGSPLEHFKVDASGAATSMGLYKAGDRVVWRGDRFLLLGGEAGVGSVYSLGS